MSKDVLADHSKEVIWDGLKEYEAYKAEYDLAGKQLGMTGIEYCLVHVLCRGDRFSHHSEALVRKVFGLDDSPCSNSLHDAEFNHPLYGKITLETRGFKNNVSTSYSTEIGGGGRGPTAKTEESGVKSHWHAHQRALHKLTNTTFYAFCNLRFMPRLFITIIESKKLIQLWGDGIYGTHKDMADGAKKWLIPSSISGKKLYKMLYGETSPARIGWVSENPWNLSSEVRDNNIATFNNECGYEATIKRLRIRASLKRDIDKEIRGNAGIYDYTPDVPEVKKGVEIVDMLGFCVKHIDKFGKV